MGLFFISLVQSVAQVIPQGVVKYYFMAVYGIAGLFVVQLLAGRFRFKAREHASMFNHGSSAGRWSVVGRILPWTAILVVSLMTLTLDDNLDYLRPSDSLGLSAIFMFANLLFAVLLFRGSFTVEE